MTERKISALERLQGVIEAHRYVVLKHGCSRGTHHSYDQTIRLSPGCTLAIQYDPLRLEMSNHNGVLWVVTVSSKLEPVAKFKVPLGGTHTHLEQHVLEAALVANNGAPVRLPATATTTCSGCSLDLFALSLRQNFVFTDTSRWKLSLSPPSIAITFTLNGDAFPNEDHIDWEEFFEMKMCPGCTRDHPAVRTRIFCPFCSYLEGHRMEIKLVDPTGDETRVKRVEELAGYLRKRDRPNMDAVMRMVDCFRLRL